MITISSSSPSVPYFGLITIASLTLIYIIFIYSAIDNFIQPILQNNNNILENFAVKSVDVHNGTQTVTKLTVVAYDEDDEDNGANLIKFDTKINERNITHDDDTVHDNDNNSSHNDHTNTYNETYTTDDSIHLLDGKSESDNNKIFDGKQLMTKMEGFRKKRGSNFDSWFGGPAKFIPNADADGPILDFAIAGFAKCGTTTMEANLGHIAPMPIADVCAPLPNTVYYAYKMWPEEYDNITNPTKILRGTKCPIGVKIWMDDFTTYLPKTLIIVGVRHPIMFFQSFWNMNMDNLAVIYRRKSPYDVMAQHCAEKEAGCRHECPNNGQLCAARARFHLPLARVGKTALDEKERELLAPDDKDGGMKLTNLHVKNPIFIYELSEIGQDDMWDALAKLLKVPYIRHDKIIGKNEDRKRENSKRLNFCDEEYDEFRAHIMPHAYNMSSWFCDYLVPAAKDENQNVYMTDPDRFCEKVRSYAEDPCNRLHRLENGTFVLREDMNVTVDKEVRW